MFRDRLVEMEKAGVTVIGSSEDSLASHRAFRAEQRLNYPLISDTEGIACSRIGACDRFVVGGDNYMERLAVLISRDGRVEAIYSINGPGAQIEALVDAVTRGK